MNFVSLQKIANLLIEIYGEVKVQNPLALCVLDQISEEYTVVGVMGSYEMNKGSKK